MSHAIERVGFIVQCHNTDYGETGKVYIEVLSFGSVEKDVFKIVN